MSCNCPTCSAHVHSSCNPCCNHFHRARQHTYTRINRTGPAYTGYGRAMISLCRQCNPSNEMQHASDRRITHPTVGSLASPCGILPPLPSHSPDTHDRNPHALRPASDTPALLRMLETPQCLSHRRRVAETPFGHSPQM